MLHEGIMSIRGQSHDAWIARWRSGNCPVHGIGCAVVPQSDDTPYKTAMCRKDACTIVVAQWPGRDTHHAKLGWIAGPDDVHTSLVKSGQIAANGPEPGRFALDVRMSWPLEAE
jgi:hypothetical protein